MANQSIYWANQPTEDLGAEILKRVDEYYEFLQTSGYGSLLRRSYTAYYKSQTTGGRVIKIGEQGEYTQLNVNHYRNLLSHLLTMTTQQAPSFEPRATNSDYESQAQVILARGLLDYYLREKKLTEYIKLAVETALVMTEGFVRAEWNTQGGEIYGVNPDTQAPIREGDIQYSNFNTFNVIRDFRKKSWDQHNWVILRSTKNRWDLVAQYPELKDRILDCPSPSDDDIRNQYVGMHSGSETLSDEDDVVVYEFYHKQTASVPHGRYTMLLDSDLVLFDGSLPYRTIPVFRIVPDKQLETTFGYTIGFDLLPIQEAVDGLYSTVTTNQSTFGVQNILVPKGHGLSVSSYASGLNLIEYDMKLGKPEALNLTQTPPEIFKFIEQLEHLMEVLSGVNSVARGNPEASLKSGAALALVQSMAIQFSIGLQQAYAMLIEDLGTATINILRDFASVPRVATIVGKANRSLMREFSGKDLSQVNRVTVDMGNPLQRTTAGKVNLAETLIQNNLIENADQYIQVITTGKLEPIIEGKQGELMLIRAENEHLSLGKEQPVIVTDNHLQHIIEHKVVLSSPESRINPDVLGATLKHISDHLAVLQDPQYQRLLAVLGHATPPPAEAPGAPGAAAELLDTNNPVTQEAAKVPQANMPSPPPGTDPRSAAIIEGQGQ